MGDPQFCYRQPNGVVTEDSPSAASPLPSSNPDPSSIGEDIWAIAEQTTQEVICCIHPTSDSVEKRKDIIEYFQRLIRGSLGYEVVPYGSVPLKTYLPDGDIDLTVLSSPSVEQTVALDVLAILQGEEENENAEYEVKDTQFIDAEVKLVKCLVQNTVIDISFNQLGGLCTLCFLEQLDRLIGKDHLFKRSIILIKAWCFYESRILGAPHGLISTYALSTLVLYIFHLFHTSLNGPLGVLYMFLDYFSKFDWDHYCISLQGPVSKSFLPRVVAEMPLNLRDNLLISEEFIKNCMDIFSVPSRGPETNLRAFPQKHLNIIDPLKENNNLGRSVHRGNFYRVRSAFKYGARKLGQILQSSSERTADEIKRFFANTVERHGLKSGNLFSSSHSKLFPDENFLLNSLSLDSNHARPGVGDQEVRRCLIKEVSLKVVSKMACSVDGSAILGSHLAGISGLRITSDWSASSCNICNSLSRLFYYAPQFYFSGSYVENGELENGMLYQVNPASLDDERMGFRSLVEHRENHFVHVNVECVCRNNHEDMKNDTFSGTYSPVATISDGLPLNFKHSELADIAGSPGTLSPLSDLSGDYDSHLRSLLYGQCCHGYALSAPVLPNSPTFPSRFQNESPCQYMLLRGTACARMSSEENNNHEEQAHTFPIRVGYVWMGERSSDWRGRNQAANNTLL